MPKTKTLVDEVELVKEIANASLDAIYVKDRDSRWIYANPSLEKIAGKPVSELLNKTDAEIYSEPEIGRTILEHDKKIMESGKAETFEEFVDFPDGRHFFVSVKSPRFDKKGNVIGIVGISHDITNRKRREQRLRESEEKFRSITESSQVEISVTRLADGLMIFANQAFENDYGYSPKELIGKNSTSFYYDVNDEAKLVNELKKKGFLNDYEVRAKKKDGTPFWTSVSTRIINYNGEKAILNTAIDISERKKVEESLKESEQLYKTIFDNRDDGFVLVEPIYDEDNNACDIRFLQINLAYEKQTGTRASNVEGKRAKEVAPNLEQEWISLCGEVAKTGRTRRIENFNKRTNKWYDASYIPFTRGRVGILFRDVTERKNLEKQLKEKERLAIIGATAGMVGHDIRNPLQAITSDVYLAKTELASIPESEEKKNALDSLQEIEKNVDYINKIVVDLQDFAKPLNPRAEVTNLKQVIDDLLTKNEIPKNVKVIVKVETEKVVADSTFINRIMYNLINNAVQAMPEGGRLTIHSSKETNDVIISVRDTGVGIPDSVKGKLFTPMFTTKAKGQGFGLAVIKRMTESLGGTVSFESQEGKGTTFTICLPQSPKQKT